MGVVGEAPKQDPLEVEAPQGVNGGAAGDQMQVDSAEGLGAGAGQAPATGGPALPWE